jgi:flavin reductase (DIM6/NTAB) family NADH-FMN oxidoreductase RutF
MSADHTLTGFVPSVETQRPYRNALSTFATGVTVITTKTAGGRIGMTANSFASVSLDPALVLWSLAKTSLRYSQFAPATHFAIHVLRVDQKELANAFAQRGDAFDLVDHEINAEGVTILNDCLARFECATYAVHEAGDHDIMVGHVLRAAESSGEPLIFAQRAYGTVTPES